MKFERVSFAPEAILPTRATSGAAGYDFYTLNNITIPAQQIVLIPTGIKAQIDDGYYLQLALRSSTPKKKGLMLANSVGIVDQDYWGPDGAENEGHIMFQVYNFTNKPVHINAGERIGQGVFMKYYKTDDDIAAGLRDGGFGSTDNMTSQQNSIARDTATKKVFGVNIFDPFSSSNVDRLTNDCISSEEDPNVGDFQND